MFLGEQGVFLSPDKGAGSGISIEEQGRLWAKDYLTGKKIDLNKLVLVVPQEDAWVMKLPAMMGDNFSLRLDDLGTIFGQCWRETSMEEIERASADWQLIYPHPDRVQADYLTRIPKHKTGVSVWQPMQFETIESAIRAQGHVLDKVVSGNDNSELTQASQMIKEIDGLAKTVLTKQLTVTDLDSLTNITGQILSTNGLINVEASRKVLMAEMLKKAFVKDSLNRINPLVMRVRLRSAYIQAIRQLVLVSKVAGKYTLNKVQLEYEREINRWALQETATLLERKLLWHEGFERHRFEPQTQLQVLEAIMQEIAVSLLTIPRVKPYLATARLSGMALIGCRPQHTDHNRLIINDERKWGWLGGDELSVVQMVRSNNFQAAEKRVEEIKALIDNVLE